MKLSEELKAVSVLVENLSADVAAWEKEGAYRGLGDRTNRPGATYTGIISQIVSLRRMLQQIRRDVEKISR